MIAPDITAVLVNFNAGPELRVALHSIADECGSRPWEAVVVDNASTDDSQRAAAEFGARVRLIQNTENIGFGRGVNQGLAATTAPLASVQWRSPRRR